MHFQIQQLHPHDWKRGRTIRLRALQDEPDAFGSNLTQENAFPDQTWQDRLTRTDAITYLASTQTDGDIGLIVGAPYDDHAGLFSMWVDPHHRQKGLGGALVDAIIQWAKTEGFSKLLLDVADQNPAAIALYASKGFQPTGQTGTLPPPRDHVKEHQRELLL